MLIKKESLIFVLISIFLVACGNGVDNPSPTLVSIVVTPSTATVSEGEFQQFIANGIYSDGSNLDLTVSSDWTSSDLLIASALTNGLVSSVGPGTVFINAAVNNAMGSASLTVNDTSYVINTTVDTWWNASTDCQAQGGHLATLRSDSDTAYAQNVIVAESVIDPVWIGGYENLDSSWSWVTGEPWDYMKWAPPHPFAGGSGCLDFAVFTGEWTDETCANNQAYLCEFK